jgi:hypothetical protein
MVSPPNPDKPVGAKRKSRFSGEPKKKLITKARKGENTKKDKLNFVLTRRKRLRCAFKISCFR